MTIRHTCCACRITRATHTQVIRNIYIENQMRFAEEFECLPVFANYGALPKP